MTNVDALKALYVALGGDADDVAGLSIISDVIQAITTQVGKTGGLLPKVTTTNNGKVLKVDAGEWAIGTDNT